VKASKTLGSSIGLAVASIAVLSSLAACGGSPESQGSTRASDSISSLDAQTVILHTSVSFLDDAPLGITVCGSGIALPSGVPVYIVYSGIPLNGTGLQVGDHTVPPFSSAVLAQANGDASYAFTDHEPLGGPDCSPDELNGEVTVAVYGGEDPASDPSETPFAIGKVPAKYWCANGGALSFNGGCP
jgi:hypothetical protein